MNQLLRILAIFLFTGNPALAQEGEIDLGIEGGPSLTNLRGQQEKFKYAAVPLYAAGISFQYHFSKMFSLKTGLSYDPKEYTGSFEMTYPYSTNIFEYRFSQHLDYLTLPLMIRFQVGEKVKFFANVGGYLGILLSHNRRVERNGNLDPNYSYYSKFLKIGSNSLDFGGCAGLGIGVPIKKRWIISLEARGNFGFANIQKNASGLFQNESAASTYSIGLLLGMSYRFNRSDNPSDKDKRDSLRQRENLRFEVGIEAGPNMSPFLESRKYQFKTGHTTIHANNSISTGISFQWNGSKYISLRTGIGYQRNYYTFVNNYGYGGSHRIDYLTIPLMARLTIGQKAHFFLNAGIFAGVAILQMENKGFAYPNSYKISNFNPFNFGVIAGTGIGIPIRKHWELSLEVRNNTGLTTALSKIPGAKDSDAPQTLRINTLSLLVGISYKLGYREEKK